MIPVSSTWLGLTPNLCLVQASNTTSRCIVEIEAPLDAPIPPTHDETVASDYYRLSLDGIDLNTNPTTPTMSAYPLQPSLSPMHDLAYQGIYGFDLFGGTPQCSFTPGHIGH